MMVVSKTTIDIDISSYTHGGCTSHCRVIILLSTMSSLDAMYYTAILFLKNSPSLL